MANFDINKCKSNFDISKQLANNPYSASDRHKELNKSVLMSKFIAAGYFAVAVLAGAAVIAKNHEAPSDETNRLPTVEHTLTPPAP